MPLLNLIALRRSSTQLTVLYPHQQMGLEYAIKPAHVNRNLIPVYRLTGPSTPVTGIPISLSSVDINPTAISPRYDGCSIMARPEQQRSRVLVGCLRVPNGSLRPLYWLSIKIIVSEVVVRIGKVHGVNNGLERVFLNHLAIEHQMT